jgi:arylsulfatase A-like enzyme
MSLAWLCSRGALVVAIGWLLATGCSAAPDSYSVLLITLDTTRADYLSSYGHPDGTTPNLDELARSGTRFDFAISTAAVTPVAHASILTGLNNKDHGLRVLSAQGGFRLSSQLPTLASVLASHGYHTAAIHSAFPVSAHFGLDRGFEVFQSFDAEIQVGLLEPGQHTWDVTRFQRRSDQTTDLVLRYVEQATSPYFLWVHYWDPHDALQIPPASFLPPESEIYPEVDDQGELVTPSRALYAAEIRYMDSQIGRLLRAVEHRGDGDDTLVVVISDHGQGLGDHGWGLHRLLYQEQIRVPLILRIPGEVQVAVVSELVRAIDVFPTVLDYLGLEPPAPVSGRSLRNLIEGRQDEERIAFADQINSYDLNASRVSTRPGDDLLYTAMDRDWKLIYRPTQPGLSELYNLSADPDEERNLYRERPDQALRLAQRLARHAPWVTEPFPPLEAPDRLSGAREALAALGYVEDPDAPRIQPEWSWICPEQLAAPDAQRSGECSTPLIPVGRLRTEGAR